MYKKIFIAVFLLLLLLPSFSMLYYQTDKSAEKGELRSFPALEKSGNINLQFFPELADYVAQHFAFRQEFITADAAIKAKLFGTSNNSQVIVGKKGWLFFEETLEDYRGQQTLSDRGYHNCAAVMRLLQEQIEEKGGNFIFTVAPNKNSIYSEYMPERYLVEADANNRICLQRELKKQGVSYLDSYALLQQEKKTLRQGETLYHKEDTHWNNLGACVIADALLEQFGRPHTDYSGLSRHAEACFAGDLYAMLYPKGWGLDEDILFDAEHSFVEEVTAGEDIVTESSEGGSSLLMFRDSFGNALYPFLADAYRTAVFTKSLPYDTDMMEEYKSRDVIIEIAERHIPEITDGIPYSMALPEQFDGDVDDTLGSDAVMQIEEFGGCHLVYGQADRRLMDDDAEILICFNGKDFCAMFEAFPAVYEMEEIAESDRDYCYGAYIDDAYFGKGEYEVEIITKKGEKYYSTGILSKMQID